MTKFAIGQTVHRLEDPTLLQGRGCYTDDLRLQGAAHAFVLRSPHAHAMIRSIDTKAAQGAPGVIAVLTGKDAKADDLGNLPCIVPVKNHDGTPRGDTPRPVLALDRVRHVGDAVALVVAETYHQARDAAELIEVDYEPLPAVADVYAAAQAGAPQVWPEIKNNIVADLHLGSKEATDAAFARAAHISKIELVQNRLVANPMEPRAAFAEYDPATDRSTLHTSSQSVAMLKAHIGDIVLKIGNKLRVRSGNVGGAFGMKAMQHPEQPMIVWASRRLKRAVRWTGDRSEGFLTDVQGRDHKMFAELALDKDGKFLAVRATVYAGMGAYLSQFAPMIPQSVHSMMPSVYAFEAAHLHLIEVTTNTVPVDAYRGAGRPEGIYITERLVDIAARELKIAPEELRRRNFIKPSQLPYTTAAGLVYDSGDFDGLQAKALKEADWAGFPARRAASEARGKLRGIGLTMYVERCGGAAPPDSVAIKVNKDRVTVLPGTVDNGQGHMTVLKQLVSEFLGVDMEKIDVSQGDSDANPFGLTGGSRFAVVTGTAAGIAAKDVIDKGMEQAAKMLEAAAADIEYGDGDYKVKGTDRKTTLFDVAGAVGGLDALHIKNTGALTFPNGCHIVEVEIDPQTGVTTIERYTIVDDFGRALNPMLLLGQVHGGTVQGIGQALLEHAVYDNDTAQLLTGSFMDYAMPRADDVPSFNTTFHHTPCVTNPLGVKGAGEAGSVGAPPAIINAIVDVLHAKKGIKHIDMPATREKVWRALNS